MTPSQTTIFGYNAFISTATSGEVQFIELDANGKYPVGIYYFLKGKAQLHVQETNEVLVDRTPGWLNSEHTSENAATPGTLVCTFAEDSTWIVIPFVGNSNVLPTVQSLSLAPASSTLISSGEKWFLGEGSVVINGTTFTGPVEIPVQVADAQCVATTQSYILKIAG